LNKAPSADRRPLASRNTRWAQALARWLAGTRITPNQISYASMGFAMLAGVLFYLASQIDGVGLRVCLLLAVLCCQLRLLCNLMDGLVAIEAGKQTPDGAVWNELPDRVSDIVIFVGVGLAVSSATLGWAAAALAVLVSYVRELGKGIDGEVDFRGPMAKPQRMAVVTVAGIAAAVLPALPILEVALWVLVVGCVVTTVLRTRTLLQRL